MQKKNLSKITETVMNFFNKTVAKVDKAVNFVKRKSKVDAKLFAETLITGCLSDPLISLERLCKLIDQRGVQITKQGLHQRFNAEATLLMQNLFTESLKAFKTERQAVLDLLKPFHSIKLLDSSGVELPAGLKASFKGYGGDASEASLKMQVMFDYMQGQVNKVIVTAGCRSDQGFSGHLDWLEKGVLYLQDLGYFKRQFFKKVSEKGAYFISRYSYPTKLLDEKGVALDLLKELRNTPLFLTKNVQLGQSEKIDVRLIACRLSDEEIEKRLRKIREKAKDRGRASSEATLELAKWSIYITNVGQETLHDEQVHLVYSLRWQIELLFKLCKSEAGVDVVSGKKTDRIVCELYAKLICVVMMLYLCFPVRWQENQELSLYKAYRTFKLSASDLFRALKTPYRLIKFIKSFLGDLKNFALKDRYRKKRKLTYQKIMDAAHQEVLV